VLFREDLRQELIRTAAEGKTVTYGYLMKKFGVSRGSSEGDTIVGSIDEIDKREYLAGAPGFGAIVVRKDTGYPGGGFFCWDSIPPELRRSKDQGNNPRLSQTEKRYIKQEQEKIWRYYQSRYPSYREFRGLVEDG